MRSSFICRQCIARFVPLPAARPSPARILRSRLHTQAPPGSTNTPPSALAAPTAVNDDTSFLGQHRTSRSRRSDESLDEDLERIPIRKTVPWQVPNDPPDRPASKWLELRHRLLSYDPYLDPLRDYVAHFYGLTTAEAIHTINQLERLSWSRNRHDPSSTRQMFSRYHKSWKRHFRRQLSALKRKSRIHATSKISKFKYSPRKRLMLKRTVQLVKWDTRSRVDLKQLKSRWSLMDADERRFRWPRLVSSAFQRNPGVVPEFIRFTLDPELCSSYVLEDTVHLLVCATECFRDRQGKLRQIADLVTFILKVCPSRRVVFDQTDLGKLISHLRPGSAFGLYETLRSREHPLHHHTLLQFASVFAKAANYKLRAMDILRHLCDQPGFVINSPAAASVCTSLMNLRVGDLTPTDGPTAPDELFKFLLHQGLRPNLITLTALMRNFCIRGRLDTAWSMFEMMLDHGFQPDSYVLATMVHASKAAGDFGSIERLLDILQTRGTWHPYIINDLLHILFRDFEAHPEKRRRQRKANNAFFPMLNLYAKFFHLGPLQRLVVLPLENMPTSVPRRYATPVTDRLSTIRSLPASGLMRPGSATLCLMLAALLRSKQSPNAIGFYFSHFRRLLANNDPVARIMVYEKGTHPYNIFLRALLQFKSSWKRPLDFITKMIHNARREKRQLGYNRLCPMPCARTWQLVAIALKNHRHANGVVMLINMMRRAGFSNATLPTWNALVTAFIMAGTVRYTVMAIRCMERAGFALDRSTLRKLELLPASRRAEVAHRLRLSRNRAAKGDQKEPDAFESMHRGAQGFLLLQHQMNVLRTTEATQAAPRPKLNRPMFNRARGLLHKYQLEKMGFFAHWKQPKRLILAQRISMDKKELAFIRSQIQAAPRPASQLMTGQRALMWRQSAERRERRNVRKSSASGFLGLAQGAAGSVMGESLSSALLPRRALSLTDGRGGPPPKIYRQPLLRHTAPPIIPKARGPSKEP